MDRRRMKRRVLYGLLVAVALAAVAGTVFMLVRRGPAGAAAARLPDGARIAIDGHVGAAEWSHCLSQRFEKTGLLRVAWDADYVYGVLAEDLPARKAGTNGDVVVARLYVDGRRVYVCFSEGWTDAGPMLRPFDVATQVGQASPGDTVRGFTGQPANEAVGSQFRCTTEFRIPLTQLGVDGGVVSSITTSVLRIRNSTLLPVQDAG